MKLIVVLDKEIQLHSAKLLICIQSDKAPSDLYCSVYSNKISKQMNMHHITRVRSRNYGSVITGTVTGNYGNRKSKNYG